MYCHLGAVAGLGRRRGAAEIGPVRVTGWVAWALHRAYHLWAMPTVDRTVRIALDWTVTTFLGRDLVALGRRDPRPLPDELTADPVEPVAADEVPDEVSVVAPDPGWGAVPTPQGSIDGPTMREPHPSFPAFAAGPVTGENPALASLDTGRHGRG